MNKNNGGSPNFQTRPNDPETALRGAKEQFTRDMLDNDLFRRLVEQTYADDGESIDLDVTSVNMPSFGYEYNFVAEPYSGVINEETGEQTMGVRLSQLQNNHGSSALSVGFGEYKYIDLVDEVPDDEGKIQLSTDDERVQSIHDALSDDGEDVPPDEVMQKYNELVRSYYKGKVKIVEAMQELGEEGSLGVDPFSGTLQLLEELSSKAYPADTEFPKRTRRG